MAFLTACSTPYKTPAFDARPGTPREFPGAADLLRAEGALDVLLVHGMCTHDADWASGAARDLYANMGGDPAQVKLRPAAVGKTGIVLFQQTLPLPAGALRLNALLWSPLTTPLKGDLCYDQSSKSAQCPAAEAAKAYPYERARLNEAIKDSLINDCLADAMIYQGKPRIDINERMQAAILQAVNTTGGRPMADDEFGPQNRIPVMVVSDSVGSKITFDAIYKLATGPGKGKEKAGIALFNRTALVFMRANQIPILALADKHLDGTASSERRDAGFPTDPIEALIQRRNAEPAGARSRSVPTVVAFSDPNDLLSYPLARSPLAAAAGYPIVDVIVSNDKSYLGLFELPNTAHLHYAGNDAVRRLIACGNPRSSACKAGWP
ncbi:MAG: hypothetical protein M3R60_18395 [Pseudomonadota bacterium]|nr:hypothetical protein [Pseudomonadota bacterium]